MPDRTNALMVCGTTITLPVGATGSLFLDLDTDVEFSEGDIVLFAIADKASVRSKVHGKYILTKVSSILSDENGKYYCKFVFTNADTRAIKAGEYFWDMTIVTDPEYDDDGDVIVENDSDDVYPIYASMGISPQFILKEVMYIV